MRAFWKAAVLGVPLSSALVLPEGWRSVPTVDAGSTSAHEEQTAARAVFNVTCPGGEVAHDQDDETWPEILTFKFDAVSASQDCSPENIILNDLPIVPFQGEKGSVSSGFFSVPSANDVTGQVSSIAGLWTLNCPPGTNSEPQAVQEQQKDLLQTFSLTVTSVDGRPIQEKSGFEILFTQSPRPSIVRIKTLQASVETDANALTSTSSLTDADKASIIQKEMQELEFLVASSERMNKAIAMKKNMIEKLSTQADTKLGDASKMIQGPSSPKSGVLDKLRGSMRCLKDRMKSLCAKWKAASASFSHGQPYQATPESLYLDRSGHLFAPNGQNVQALPGWSFPTTTTANPTWGTATGIPSQHWPPPESNFSHAGLHILIFFPFFLVLISIFVFLRRYNSQARRSERLWARESRRNTRAFRHAQRRQAWRSWWTRLCQRGEDQTGHYEEKRARVQNQEARLEDSMQEEIRSLRSAAEMVTNLVTPNARRPDESTTSPSSHPHPRPTRSSSSRRLSRSDSLPSYRRGSVSEYSEPPPVYDENGAEVTGIVADGFQYVRPHTPSPTELWTPSTSVRSPSEGSQSESEDEKD